MGGVLICWKCEAMWHSYSGVGEWIEDKYHCDNCIEKLQVKQEEE